MNKCSTKQELQKLDTKYSFLYDTPWLIINGHGGNMLRINGYLLYRLGGALKPLEDIQTDTKLRDANVPLFIARVWLEYFLADNFVPITFCKSAGNDLVKTIRKIIPSSLQDIPKEKLDTEINASELQDLKSGLNTFEIVLNTELGQLDTYFISRTGLYSTPELIEKADEHFNPIIREKFSDSTKLDIRQAGRCLAFGLPTAAGFHIMRATETILKQYYIAHVEKTPRGRNWGLYIGDLKKTKANPKVVAVLDQIRTLHRNPTIHPEVVLSDNEALILFSIAQSAITAMMEDMT